MSNTAKIGKYEVTLEARGLRIARLGDTPPLLVRPLLTFSLTERGRNPTPYQFVRVQVHPDGIELHGNPAERIAVTVRLRVAPTLDGLLVEMRLVNITGDSNVRLTATLALTGEAEPRWMVPGFFYGDNKPAGGTRVYPSYSEGNRDPRRFVSNYWSIRSDRAALPSVFAWTYGVFAYMTTDEVFGRSIDEPRGLGISGLHFGSVDGQPSLGVEFPYREAPVKYSFCHEDKTDPDDVLLALPAAHVLAGNFQIGLGAPDLHAYNPVLRTVYKELQTANPQRGAMAAEDAESIAHGGLLRWHYDPRQGAIYETTSFDRPPAKKRTAADPAIMHAGWLSGALPAYTLLRAGRESNHPESITAGAAVLNKFCSQLSPAGAIFPVWTEEAGWACSFGPQDGAAHSRTVAEAILFILRSIALEVRYNAQHPQWQEAAISSLNYAMGSQREDGAFPVYYDMATGAPISYEGCGGLPWVAAMATGAALMQKPHYRDVAHRGGDYYAQFVNSELLYGCVEDQHLVPTSDDCHWAVIVYVTLYELDRDMKWLHLARKAADLALTWRKFYNVQFSRDSVLGRYQVATRGGDISSAVAPTLGISGMISYPEFVKLANFTGDSYYRERSEDARLFATQLIARDEGHFNARAGLVAGHIYATDWLQPKGMVSSVGMAMSATLIKYGELTRRKLMLSRSANTNTPPAELEKELGSKPFFYSDIHHKENSNGADVASPPAIDPEVAAESQFVDMTSSMAGLLGLGGPPAPGSRTSTSGVVRRPKTQDLASQAAEAAAGPRGSSVENRILPTAPKAHSAESSQVFSFVPPPMPPRASNPNNPRPPASQPPAPRVSQPALPAVTPLPIAPPTAAPTAEDPEIKYKIF
ncbi:hypothetical protein BH09SUM1_BH09SUM1_18380 [soil metagenome]